MIKLLSFVSTLSQAETFMAVVGSLTASGGTAVKVVSIEPISLSGNRVSTWLRQEGIPLITLWNGKKPLKDFDTITRWFRAWPQIKAELTDTIIKEDPSLIVIGNDSGFIERFIISMAKARGIPTLLIQDGIVERILKIRYISLERLRSLFKRIAHSFAAWIGFIPQCTLYGCGGCDYLAVVGEYTRNLLIDRGVDPASIIITGQPRYDSLFHLRNSSYYDEKIRLQTKEEKKIILFTGELLDKYKTNDLDDKQLIEVLKTIAKHFSATHHLIIKTHPSESINDYDRYLNDEDRFFISVRDDNLFNLLGSADVLITQGSTVMLEAMVCKKPVVILDLRRLRKNRPLMQSGALLVVYDREELISKVEKALFDKSTRESMFIAQDKVIREHLFLPDGEAGRRVAEVIDMIIANLPSG